MENLNSFDKNTIRREARGNPKDKTKELLRGVESLYKTVKPDAKGRKPKLTSFTAYVRNVNTVHRVVKNGQWWDTRSLQWLIDYETVLKAIDANWSNLKTRNAKIKSISAVLKHVTFLPPGVHEAYQKAFIALNKTLDRQRGENLLTGKQKNKLIPWPEWVRKPLPNIPLDAVLAGLYQWVPRRPGSYRRLRVRINDDLTRTQNYILIRGGELTLVLNQYKTALTYGQQRFKLPKKVSRVIVEYLKKSGLKVGQRLFPASDGRSEMEQSTFTQHINRMLLKMTGKSLTATDLRIMYASHYASQPLSINQLEQHASKLGHSVHELLRYKKLDL